MEDQLPAPQSEAIQPRPYLRAGQAVLAELGFTTEAADTLPEDSTPAAASIPRPLPNRLALDALGKARLFVQEQAEHTKETFQGLRKDPKRLVLLGALGAAIAAAKPVVEAGLEKVPVIQMIDGTEVAQGAEILQRGADSYPWRELKNAGIECMQYAKWWLLQNGIPEARTSAIFPDLARNQFELVNGTPAPGSLGNMDNPDGSGHVIIVESVDGNTLTFSDYNGWGGADEFSRTRISLEELKAGTTQLQFIHFELPPVANGDFMGTGPDKEKKDTLSQSRNGLYEGFYLTSPNGQRLLLFHHGNLAQYDKAHDFTKTWQSGTSGEGGSQSVQIEVKGKGQSNLLTITNNEGDLMWSRKIGVGTDRLTINDDGSIAFYRGNKLVGSGANVEAAAKAAAGEKSIGGRKKNAILGDAEYARRNKNSISKRLSLVRGTFLRSKNRRFLLAYVGNKVKVVNNRAPQTVEWQARITKQANVLSIKTGKHGNRLVATNANVSQTSAGHRKKPHIFRSWYIAAANKVTISNSGKLVGFKGRRKVWEARTIATAPRAAKAAAHRAAQARRR